MGTMTIKKIRLKRNEKSITVGDLAARMRASVRTQLRPRNGSRWLLDYVSELNWEEARHKAFLERTAREFSAMLRKPVNATTALTLEELAEWNISKEDIEIEQDRLTSHLPSYYEIALARVLGVAVANDKVAPNGIAAPNAVGLSSEHLTVVAETETPAREERYVPRLKIASPNSKAAINAYIEYRAEAIYTAGEATTIGGIAKIIAAEMKKNGYKSERSQLSPATVERAIPRGLTGGRASNGRKSKGN